MQKLKGPTAESQLIIGFLKDLKETLAEKMPDRYESSTLVTCFSEIYYLPPGHKYEYFEICCTSIGSESITYEK